jgi:hypothetical protein
LQIEGKTFLEAFESLRGGGAITEVEGAKGQQAISRMNKAQSEVEYIKAARELQDVVRVKVLNVLVRKPVLAVLPPAHLPQVAVVWT